VKLVGDRAVGAKRCAWLLSAHLLGRWKYWADRK